MDYNDNSTEKKDIETHQGSQQEPFDKNSPLPKSYGPLSLLRSKKSRKLTPLYIIVSLLACVALLVFIVRAIGMSIGESSELCSAVAKPSPANKYIGVEDIGGERIGLSYGSTAFDLASDRLNRRNKCNAVSKLVANDLASAKAFWNAAIHEDPRDAEAQIYLEDKVVEESGHSYLTYVVGVTLQKEALRSGGSRGILQGAFLAQHAYNRQHPAGSKIRLLIANSGSDPTYATRVAQQIVQAALADPHIVAILGWPNSSRSVNVQSVLANANPPIPIVSALSSSDLLTNNAYFLRVTPTDTQQARMAANYVQHTLKKQKVAVFYDPGDAYCSTLKQNFSGSFVIIQQEYTVAKPDQLDSLLQAFLQKHPDIDMIYFAGYAKDLQQILTTLQKPELKKFAHLPIMGGDALSVLTNYPHPDDLPGKGQLSFTAFAFYKEINPQSPQASTFLDDYRKLFDPANRYPSAIGSSLPDSGAILGYDAMQVLLNGSERLFGNRQPGFDDKKALWLALSDPRTVIQGLSGPIQFGTDHNPTNKRILMLSVNSSGKVQPASP